MLVQRVNVFVIIESDVLFSRKHTKHSHASFCTDMYIHKHTHLWFDGAVDGWGASGLHAAAAEGLGAGREGGVGDAVGRFVLQRWGALPVQLRSLLHLGQVTYHHHSELSTQHSQTPVSPACTPATHHTILTSLAVLKEITGRLVCSL